jgi:hypothetical protein
MRESHTPNATPAVIGSFIVETNQLTGAIQPEPEIG